MAVDFSQADKTWWAKDDVDSLLSSMGAAYAQLRSEDTRNDAYRVFMGLYTNRDIHTDSVQHYFQAATDVEGNKFSRVPFNLIKMVIDAVMSRVAKLRPRPVFLTEDGNHSLQKKAKRLQKWVDTQFDTQNVYDLGVDVALDATIFGTGALKIFKRDDEVVVERVFPGELYVDELEALYGNPQQIFQKKYIPKETLKELFPQFEEDIEQSGVMSDRFRDDFGFNTIVDQVEVVEAWHLPSKKGAKDGRHVIFIDNAILLDENYPHRDFPFAFYRWGKEVRGFYGIGLAEDLIGLHVDVNNTIRRIERSVELTATPQVWIENGSKVSPTKITNIPGQINYFQGNPPIFMTPPTIPGDLFEYLQNQIGRAFQIAGLSDAAQGRRIPPGLETGQAVRDFHDVETERFILPARRFEQLYLDIARLIVRTGKQISSANPSFTVVAEKDKYTIERIPWKDVELDDTTDAYVLKTFPASSLSQTPAGRKQDVQDFLNMGVITPDQAVQLLDFPDLERFNNLERAAADNIDRIIEKILDENEYEPPEPFMDLQLALKKAQAAVNRATRMGVPEEHVSKLRMFARQVNTLVQRAQQELLQRQLLQQQALNPTAPPPVGANGQSPTAITGQEL